MYSGFKCKGCEYEGMHSSEHDEPHYVCVDCREGDSFTIKHKTPDRGYALIAIVLIVLVIYFIY